MKNRGITIKNMILIWVLGIAGQLCWNLENQWFNTYVYNMIGPFPRIITGMLIFSAIATAFSTFLFGTLSDRKGKRKPFICIGYIIWGLFTILFGFTHLLSKAALPYYFVATMVVLADGIMSFFGSMGNDSGFSSWTTDILNEDNKGFIGTSIATQPVIGTIAGTLLGGAVIGSSLGYVGFFSIMGGLVTLIGFACLFLMKDQPNIQKNIDGSFWHQFFKNFNFKDFFSRHELVLVNIMMTIFFIAFNCFFNHIGNLFLYNYGFSIDNFGLIEGVALMIGVVVSFIFAPLIQKNIAPLLTFIAILSEIIGLIILIILSSFHLFDNEVMFSAKNILLIIGMIIVGFGYILFMQVIMVWAKTLYPEDKRGQFEGIKILFFVLLPMIFGSLLSNILIETVGTYTIIDPGYGEPIYGFAPNHYLFIASSIVLCFEFIPLYFVNKLYKKRIQSSSK